VGWVWVGCGFWVAGGWVVIVGLLRGGKEAAAISIDPTIHRPDRLLRHRQVSRSLAACQGALLLVDAVQGIQAQVCVCFLEGLGASIASLVGLAGNIFGLHASTATSTHQPTHFSTTQTPPTNPYPNPTPQTVANFYLAFEQELSLLPVLNKIDLPAADPVRISAQLSTVFGLEGGNAIHVSAKTGVGLDALLPAIVE